MGARALPEAAKAFTYASIPELLKEMGRVMPVYKGIEKLSKEGDHLQWGGNLLYRNGHFDKMPEGKARFSVVPVPYVEIPKGYVYVTTRRGRQFNSMTYGSHDPLTNHQRGDVFVSSEDAETFGVREGDRIRLKSEVGTMDGTCRVVPIRARNVQVHWPEGNAIIPRRYDPVSGEPDYNTLATMERVSPT